MYHFTSPEELLTYTYDQNETPIDQLTDLNWRENTLRCQLKTAQEQLSHVLSAKQIWNHHLLYGENNSSPYQSLPRTLKGDSQ
ncbi:MAG: hypothetical protein FWF59_00395 [Turicibacter sp.]|nr:hypothetical protein [Turicibacter sp.]